MCNSCWDTYETFAFILSLAVCDSPRERDETITAQNVWRVVVNCFQRHWRERDERSLHWSSSHKVCLVRFVSIVEPTSWMESEERQTLLQDALLLQRQTTTKRPHYSSSSLVSWFIIICESCVFVIDSLCCCVSTPSWLDWDWIGRNQRHRIISLIQRCAMLK